MGENVLAWSKTASSNSNADGSINWAENQLPSTVNNSARSMMAAIAKFRDDNNGTLTSTGSSNAYALTANTAYTALAQGLCVTLKANFTNTGAATLTLTPSGAGAFASKAIRVVSPAGDIALTPGQMAANGIYNLVYDTAANSAAGAWLLLNSATANTSGDLYVTDFGAVSGAANNRTEFQAAYDAAVDGQRIIIPAGTWAVGTALTMSGTKRVTWIQQPGAIISSASLVNVTGMAYATKAGSGEYYWNANQSTWTSRFMGFQDRALSNGAGSGQNDFLFLFGRNTVARASNGGTVTLDLRGYIAAGNTDGYCFAQNTYALCESSADGTLVGNETDLWNEGTLVSTPFSGNVKFGQTIVNQGPKVCTSAILISYGVSVKGFYEGITIAYNAIDHVSSSSKAFNFQDTVIVWENGDVTLGKPGKGDLTIAGIDFIPSTGGARFTAPSGQPHQLYQARAGTLNATDHIGQIIHYGRNLSGTYQSWGSIQSTLNNAVAGTEQLQWDFSGLYIGVNKTFLSIQGNFMFCPTDNSSSIGHPSFRWSTVYAATGTINTSDATEKEWIGEYDTRAYDAILDVPVGFYRWKEAIKEKGDKARLHFGATSQAVQDAFKKHGLNAADFALFCSDPVTQTVKRTRKSTRHKTETVSIADPQTLIKNGVAVRREASKTITRPMYTDHLLFDENGNPIMENIFVRHPDEKSRTLETRQMTHREPVMEEFDEEYTETVPVINDDGSAKMRLGLRYDQFDRLRAEALRRKG